MANQQGWNEQTPAVKALLQGAIGGARRATRSRKPRKKAARASGAKRSKRTSAKRKTKRVVMKAGSAAAKAWGRKMARLRKK